MESMKLTSYSVHCSCTSTWPLHFTCWIVISVFPVYSCSYILEISDQINRVFLANLLKFINLLTVLFTVWQKLDVPKLYAWNKLLKYDKLGSRILCLLQIVEIQDIKGNIRQGWRNGSTMDNAPSFCVNNFNKIPNITSWNDSMKLPHIKWFNAWCCPYMNMSLIIHSW